MRKGIHEGTLDLFMCALMNTVEAERHLTSTAACLAPSVSSSPSVMHLNVLTVILTPRCDMCDMMQSSSIVTSRLLAFVYNTFVCNAAIQICYVKNAKVQKMEQREEET